MLYSALFDNARHLAFTRSTVLEYGGTVHAKFLPRPSILVVTGAVLSGCVMGRLLECFRRRAKISGV